MENAKGYVTLELPTGEVDIELGWNEVADLDRALKAHGDKPFMPTLFDLQETKAPDIDILRLAVYHGLRGRSKVKSAREAGELLKGADLAKVIEALIEALTASGLISSDDSGEA